MLETGTPELPLHGFDVVSMWHTLEHAFDPTAALNTARNYLSEQGILVVEVPNERCLENAVFGPRSFLYEAPVHLYDFDLQTLQKFMSKTGLEIVAVEYPVGAGGWFGSLQRLLTRDRAFKQFDRYLPFIMAIGALIYPLELLLSLTPWGSVLRVYARKR